MQITFDPADLTDCEHVRKILSDMSPEAVKQALADPVPMPMPQVSQTIPNPAPAPSATPAPGPPAAPGPPVTDDPLPNPGNVRAPSDLAPVGGTITEESFRARIQAVGQRVGMDKLKAAVSALGFDKLNKIPTTQYIAVLTSAEALEA